MSAADTEEQVLERLVALGTFYRLRICETCRLRLLHVGAPGSMREGRAVMPPDLHLDCEAKVMQAVRLLLSGFVCADGKG